MIINNKFWKFWESQMVKSYEWGKGILMEILYYNVYTIFFISVNFKEFVKVWCYVMWVCVSPVSAKGSPACIKGEPYRLRIWQIQSQGLRIFGGSMWEGEVCCGTTLFDFSVLGSLTEKSSDLVQMLSLIHI